MNFGKWIVVAFILFTAFIATLVTVCVKQDISLVSKEYYKDELAYQDQIVRISNTRDLVSKPSISKVNNNAVEISFHQNVERGEVKLFCPSDSKMDRTYKVELVDNKQSLDVSALKNGMYRMKVYWSANGKDYFLEEVIYI